MFYHVTADLHFTEQDEANDFYHDCQLAIDKSQIINQGQDNEERGHIMLERCHHDEDPTLPCELITSAFTSL